MLYAAWSVKKLSHTVKGGRHSALVSGSDAQARAFF